MNLRSSSWAVGALVVGGLVAAVACSSQGSTAAVDGSLDAPAAQCTVDRDCNALLPATTPKDCATASCDALSGRCVFNAKDEDGDGHAAANCTSNTNVPVQAGDDCNDDDKNIFPGHPKPCHEATDGGAAPVGFCTGARSCLEDGKESACLATLTCLGNACVDGACTGDCIPGATKCTTGNVVETCSAEGKWEASAACGEKATCTTNAHGSACAGSCDVGAKACSGNAVQTCESNATWGPAVACNASLTCVDGACAGECGPGQTECLANGVATCTSKGKWPEAPSMPCTNSTCLLDDVGVPSCQGSCAPGQTVTCNPAPACNTTTLSCGFGAAPGTFAACPPAATITFTGVTPDGGVLEGGTYGDPCSVGTGACAAVGTVVCQGPDANGHYFGRCNAEPGTPSGFSTTPAPNGSWDWNCDGEVEAEYPIQTATCPDGFNCECLEPAQYCANLTTATCTSENPTSASNALYANLDCNDHYIICGQQVSLFYCSVQGSSCASQSCPDGGVCQSPLAGAPSQTLQACE